MSPCQECGENPVDQESEEVGAALSLYGEDGLLFCDTRCLATWLARECQS